MRLDSIVESANNAPSITTTNIERSCLFAVVIMIITFHAFWHLGGIHANEWGSWDMLPGHAGVEFRVRTEEHCSSDGACMWWIQFRNRCKETVSFDFRITRIGEHPQYFSDHTMIPAGSIREGWNMVAQRTGGQIKIWTENWRFGRQAK